MFKTTDTVPIPRYLEIKTPHTDTALIFHYRWTLFCQPYFTTPMSGLVITQLILLWYSFQLSSSHISYHPNCHQPNCHYTKCHHHIESGQLIYSFHLTYLPPRTVTTPTGHYSVDFVMVFISMVFISTWWQSEW